VAAHQQVERVAALLQQRRRQRDQLRIVAVAGDRLGHAPAAVDALAVQEHLDVAADALDAEREHLVGLDAGRAIELNAIAHQAVEAWPRVGPVVGQRDRHRRLLAEKLVGRGL
jgi:hypothetical protein